VLLLDEVAVLGRLDVLEKQSGLLRAYCTPVLIWQNLPQVAKIYGDNATAFLANPTVRLFFGVNDNDTAEYVATMLGNTGAESGSSSVSMSAHGWEQKGRSQSQSDSGYWLLDAAEIQRLPLTRVIAKFRNLPFPVLGRRLDYRKVWRWRGQWDRWEGPPVGLDNEPRSPEETERPEHMLPPPPEANAPAPAAP